MKLPSYIESVPIIYDNKMVITFRIKWWGWPILSALILKDKIKKKLHRRIV